MFDRIEILEHLAEVTGDHSLSVEIASTKTSMIEAEDSADNSWLWDDSDGIGHYIHDDTQIIAS